nr:MAG: mitochondrial genome maintenance [Bacteriophage sp.]
MDVLLGKGATMSGLVRGLRPDEVECRIGQVSKSGKGLSLLLYKTSRTDMALLDEAFGPMNWRCSYEEVKGVLNCTLSVYDADKGIWIDKQAAGTESNMESEKGESSDALKRAGFLWGIGRELYTAPFIWIRAEDCNIADGKCRDTFAVDAMEVVDGRITALTVTDERTRKVVYRWAIDRKPARGREAPADVREPPATDAEVEAFQGACNEFSFLTGKEVADILDALEKTKTLRAVGFTQWKDAPSRVIDTARAVVESWIKRKTAENRDAVDSLTGER